LFLIHIPKKLKTSLCNFILLIGPKNGEAYNSAAELVSIFKLQCTNLDYTLSQVGEKKLFESITNAYTNRDKSFGNGRFVRNLFEKTLEKQANRIASVPSLTKEILTTITSEDIPSE
jgi:hypothetical protein